MKRLQLLALIACLIVYGSIYPFNFSQAAPGAFVRLFANWRLFTSPGDMLGNVGLFVPWGLIGVWALEPRWAMPRAVVATALAGLALALGLQILQIWVPSRDATMADVFWNLVGISAGLLAFAIARNPMRKAIERQPLSLVPVCLLLGILLAEWLPMVPSIDLQLIKDQLKSFWVAPSLSTVSVLHQFAMALLAGHLLAELSGLRKSLWQLPVLLFVVAVGSLFMRHAQLNMSTAFGMALGTVTWWAIANISPSRRNTIVWLGLIAAYTIGAFAPFQLRDEVATISWLPFAAMLEGSMLSNLRSVTGSLVIFCGILYVAAASRQFLLASIGLALWVFLLELAQTLIETRTSDMTEPLLVLLLGLLLKGSHAQRTNRPDPGHPHVAVASQKALPARTQAIGKVLVLSFVMASAAIVLSMATVLKLPGIPYNVRELFRANGSLPALFGFSLSLLWMGGGAAWLGNRVANSRSPTLQLPFMALLVSLISLALLWASVTTESIEDISGSANVFWFVTNKDTWGKFWRHIFLFVDTPAVIGFLEHCVRYCALYAPLPICLGLLLALHDRPDRRFGSFWRSGRLLASTGLLLWLCKAIAFDWTSTDNLNELIARDGDWGWGGGGYLYGLLLLLCLNGMLLSKAVRTTAPKLGVILLLSIVALSLGWWLINAGLDQHVEKYGHVFSGTQFLLGPDRTHPLPEELLFLRWCIVQGGAVLILATGVWLGQMALGKPNFRQMGHDEAVQS